MKSPPPAPTPAAAGGKNPSQDGAGAATAPHAADGDPANATAGNGKPLRATASTKPPSGSVKAAASSNAHKNPKKNDDSEIWPGRPIKNLEESKIYDHFDRKPNDSSVHGEQTTKPLQSSSAAVKTKKPKNDTARLGLKPTQDAVMEALATASSEGCASMQTADCVRSIHRLADAELDPTSDQILIWLKTWRNEAGKVTSLNSLFEVNPNVLDTAMIDRDQGSTDIGGRVYLAQDLSLEARLDHLLDAGLHIGQNWLQGLPGTPIQQLEAVSAHFAENEVLTDHEGEYTVHDARQHMHDMLNELQMRSVLLVVGESPLDETASKPTFAAPKPPNGLTWVWFGDWKYVDETHRVNMLAGIDRVHIKSNALCRKLKKMMYYSMNDLTPEYLARLQAAATRPLHIAAPEISEPPRAHTFGAPRTADSDILEMQSSPRQRRANEVELVVPSGRKHSGTRSIHPKADPGYVWTHDIGSNTWSQVADTPKVSLGGTRLKQLFCPFLTVANPAKAPLLGQQADEALALLKTANAEIQRGCPAVARVRPIVQKCWDLASEMLTTIEEKQGSSQTGVNDVELKAYIGGRIVTQYSATPSAARGWILTLKQAASSHKGFWSQVHRAAGTMRPELLSRVTQPTTDKKPASSLYRVIMLWDEAFRKAAQRTDRKKLIEKCTFNTVLVHEAGTQTLIANSTLLGEAILALRLSLGCQDTTVAVDDISESLVKALSLIPSQESVIQSDVDEKERVHEICVVVAGKIVTQIIDTKRAGEYDFSKNTLLINKAWGAYEGLIWQLLEAARTNIKTPGHPLNKDSYVHRALVDLNRATSKRHNTAKKVREQKATKAQGEVAVVPPPPPRHTIKSLAQASTPVVMKTRACVDTNAASVAVVADIVDISEKQPQFDLPAECKLSHTDIHGFLKIRGVPVSETPTIQITPRKKQSNGRIRHCVTLICKDQDTFNTVTERFPLYIDIPTNAGKDFLKCKMVLKRNAQYGTNIMRICFTSTAGAELVLKEKMGEYIFEQTVMKIAVSNDVISEEFEDSLGEIYDTWEILDFYEDVIYLDDDVVGNGTWNMIIRLNTDYNPKAEECLSVDLKGQERQYFVMYEEKRLNTSFHLHSARKSRAGQVVSAGNEAWDGTAASLTALLAKDGITAAHRRRVVKTINSLRLDLGKLHVLSPDAPSHELGSRAKQVDDIRTCIEFVLKRLGILTPPPKGWLCLSAGDVLAAHDVTVNTLALASKRKDWKLRFDPETSSVIAIWKLSQAPPPATPVVNTSPAPVVSTSPAPAKKPARTQSAAGAKAGGTGGSKAGKSEINAIAAQTTTNRIQTALSKAAEAFQVLSERESPDSAAWGSLRTETINSIFELFLHYEDGRGDATRLTEIRAALDEPIMLEHFDNANYLKLLVSLNSPTRAADFIQKVRLERTLLVNAELGAQRAAEEHDAQIALKASAEAENTSAAHVHRQNKSPGVEPEAESTHKQSQIEQPLPHGQASGKAGHHIATETKQSKRHKSSESEGSPAPKTGLRLVRASEKWTRLSVKADHLSLYLFEENHRDKLMKQGHTPVPSDAQAVIRGLSNAIGLRTCMGDDAPGTDAGYEQVKTLLNEDFEEVYTALRSGAYTKVVLPVSGQGTILPLSVTGAATLAQRAPKTNAYLAECIKKLGRWVATHTQVTRGAPSRDCWGLPHVSGLANGEARTEETATPTWDSQCANDGALETAVLGPVASRSKRVIDSMNTDLINTNELHLEVVNTTPSGADISAAELLARLGLVDAMVSVMPVQKGTNTAFLALGRLVGTTGTKRTFPHLADCPARQRDVKSGKTRGRKIHHRGEVQSPTGADHAKVQKSATKMAQRCRAGVVKALNTPTDALLRFLSTMGLPVTGERWETLCRQEIENLNSKQEPSIRLGLPVMSFLMKASIIGLVRDKHSGSSGECARLHVVIENRQTDLAAVLVGSSPHEHGSAPFQWDLGIVYTQGTHNPTPPGPTAGMLVEEIEEAEDTNPSPDSAKEVKSTNTPPRGEPEGDTHPEGSTAPTPRQAAETKAHEYCAELITTRHIGSSPTATTSTLNLDVAALALMDVRVTSLKLTDLSNACKTPAAMKKRFGHILESDVAVKLTKLRHIVHKVSTTLLDTIDMMELALTVAAQAAHQSTVQAQQYGTALEDSALSMANLNLVWLTSQADCRTRMLQGKFAEYTDLEGGLAQTASTLLKLDINSTWITNQLPKIVTIVTMQIQDEREQTTGHSNLPADLQHVLQQLVDDGDEANGPGWRVYYSAVMLYTLCEANAKTHRSCADERIFSGDEYLRRVIKELEERLENAGTHSAMDPLPDSLSVVYDHWLHWVDLFEDGDSKKCEFQRVDTYSYNLEDRNQVCKLHDQILERLGDMVDAYAHDTGLTGIVDLAQTLAKCQRHVDRTTEYERDSSYHRKLAEVDPSKTFTLPPRLESGAAFVCHCDEGEENGQDFWLGRVEGTHDPVSLESNITASFVYPKDGDEWFASESDDSVTFAMLGGEEIATITARSVFALVPDLDHHGITDDHGNHTIPMSLYEDLVRLGNSNPRVVDLYTDKAKARDMPFRKANQRHGFDPTARPYSAASPSALPPAVKPAPTIEMDEAGGLHTVTVLSSQNSVRSQDNESEVLSQSQDVILPPTDGFATAEEELEDAYTEAGGSALGGTLLRNAVNNHVGTRMTHPPIGGFAACSCGPARRGMKTPHTCALGTKGEGKVEGQDEGGEYEEDPPPIEHGSLAQQAAVRRGSNKRCHHCGDAYHWKTECPAKKAEAVARIRQDAEAAARTLEAAAEGEGDHIADELETMQPTPPSSEGPRCGHPANPQDPNNMDKCDRESSFTCDNHVELRCMSGETTMGPCNMRACASCTGVCAVCKDHVCPQCGPRCACGATLCHLHEGERCPSCSITADCDSSIPPTTPPERVATRRSPRTSSPPTLFVGEDNAAAKKRAQIMRIKTEKAAAQDEGEGADHDRDCGEDDGEHEVEGETATVTCNNCNKVYTHTDRVWTKACTIEGCDADMCWECSVALSQYNEQPVMCTVHRSRWLMAARLLHPDPHAYTASSTEPPTTDDFEDAGAREELMILLNEAASAALISMYEWCPVGAFLSQATNTLLDDFTSCSYLKGLVTQLQTSDSDTVAALGAIVEEVHPAAPLGVYMETTDGHPWAASRVDDSDLLIMKGLNAWCSALYLAHNHAVDGGHTHVFALMLHSKTRGAGTIVACVWVQTADGPALSTYRSDETFSMDASIHELVHLPQPPGDNDQVVACITNTLDIVVSNDDIVFYSTVNALGYGTLPGWIPEAALDPPPICTGRKEGPNPTPSPPARDPNATRRKHRAAHEAPKRPEGAGDAITVVPAHTQTKQDGSVVKRKPGNMRNSPLHAGAARAHHGRAPPGNPATLEEARRARDGLTAIVSKPRRHGHALRSSVGRDE